jgi:hypothetical protein
MKRNIYKKTEFGVDFSCSAQRIDDFLSGYLTAKTSTPVSGMYRMVNPEDMRTFAKGILAVADQIDNEWSDEDKTDDKEKVKA